MLPQVISIFDFVIRAFLVALEVLEITETLILNFY